jgi:hypothetical protein
MNELPAQKTSVVSQYTENIFFPLASNQVEAAQEAIVWSEQTYDRLMQWTGWTALRARGIAVDVQSLDVMPTHSWRGPKAITINLTPHPFVGGENVMPFREFEEALKWAQDPSCTQMPEAKL